MKNDQRYFFTSTLPRERIFITIFRVWQNALLEQVKEFLQDSNMNLNWIVFSHQIINNYVQSYPLINKVWMNQLKIVKNRSI